MQAPRSSSHKDVGLNDGKAGTQGLPSTSRVRRSVPVRCFDVLQVQLAEGLCFDKGK